MTSPNNPDTVGSGEPNENAFPPVEELGYERARKELAETVSILERGQMSLDESLTYWERAEALVTAQASDPALVGADPDADVVTVRLSLERVDGAWKIARLVPV